MIRLLALLALAMVAACRAPPAPQRPVAQVPGAAQYVDPPQVVSVRRDAASDILQGTAPPNAQVRLTTPEGDARLALAGKDGRWTLALPVETRTRLFGVSARTAEGAVQAQGYLVLTSDGRAAVLRAGAGALRIGASTSASIRAFDYDREGGSVVSGFAPPGSMVTLRVDGQQAVEGRADDSGRFSLAPSLPVAAGVRRIDVQGAGFSAEATVEVARPEPLGRRAFRAVEGGGNVRLDWAPPGGGVQSTLLLG